MSLKEFVTRSCASKRKLNLLWVFSFIKHKQILVFICLSLYCSVFGLFHQKVTIALTFARKFDSLNRSIIEYTKRWIQGWQVFELLVIEICICFTNTYFVYVF